MTPALVPESAAEGVTKRRRSRRRPPSSAPAAPGAGVGELRYLPPTVEEVGRAAMLCFRDTESDEQIARQLGIVRRTLARWKKRTEFAAAIAALQAWQEAERAASVAVEASQAAHAKCRGERASAPTVSLWAALEGPEGPDVGWPS